MVGGLRPGCMDGLRKCYSHLVGGSFLAWKAALALSGCLTTESADYDYGTCSSYVCSVGFTYV